MNILKCIAMYLHARNIHATYACHVPGQVHNANIYKDCAPWLSLTNCCCGGDNLCALKVTVITVDDDTQQELSQPVIKCKGCNAVFPELPEAQGKARMTFRHEGVWLDMFATRNIVRLLTS